MSLDLMHSRPEAVLRRPALVAGVVASSFRCAVTVGSRKGNVLSKLTLCKEGQLAPQNEEKVRIESMITTDEEAQRDILPRIACQEQEN